MLNLAANCISIKVKRLTRNIVTFIVQDDLKLLYQLRLFPLENLYIKYCQIESYPQQYLTPLGTEHFS